MKKNVGAFDGLVRMIIAIAIIFYAGLVGPWWLGFIALVPVVTAALFYCPVWDIVGVNTCHGD
jgi:hypothetical protein